MQATMRLDCKWPALVSAHGRCITTAPCFDIDRIRVISHLGICLGEMTGLCAW